MSGVFISYRRDDSAGFAGRLFDTLLGAFPSHVIFIDVDGIDAGLDFAEVLDKRLASCEVFLAIIGRKWLDVGVSGTRRIDEPQDYVRAEIEAALKRSIRVIPVLVDGAQMPSQQVLPASLVPLTRRNSLEVSHARFASDVQRLIEVLSAILPKAPPPPPRRAVGRSGWIFGGAVAAIVTLTAIYLGKPWSPAERRRAEVTSQLPAAAPPPTAQPKPEKTVVAERTDAEPPSRLAEAPAHTSAPPPAARANAKPSALDVVTKADLDSDKASAWIRIGPIKVVTRKAWCERLTVYTEFGNYSLVEKRVETGPAATGGACILRTEWKDHRTEKILQSDTSPKPRLLNQSLNLLCPETYAYMAKNCAVE